MQVKGLRNIKWFYFTFPLFKSTEHQLTVDWKQDGGDIIETLQIRDALKGFNSSVISCIIHLKNDEDATSSHDKISTLSAVAL